MNQENVKKNIFKIVGIILIVVIFLYLVIIFNKNKDSTSTSYTSIMESKGFSVEDITDNSNSSITKTYNAKNSSKNYSSAMSQTKSTDYASVLYNQLKINLYNNMSDDSSWVPKVNENDNTYTIETDNYYTILSISGKNVCYILVPINDKSVAEEIMNELGY